MLDKPHILIIVDKIEDRDTLSRILQTDCQVWATETGQQALEMIYNNPIDVVILDLCLRSIPPIEILRAIKHHDPDIEIVIVSGQHAEADTTLKAFLYGVSDYIPKPFQLIKILSVIKSTVEKRGLNLQLKQLFKEILKLNGEISNATTSCSGKERNILMKLSNLISGHFIQDQHFKTDRHQDYLEFARVLTYTLDSKDTYTHGHSERVSFYSDIIAENLQVSSMERKDIQIAAYLHDIGKLGINNNIMHKKKPLNSQEWKIIKNHPEKGVDLIKPLRHAENIRAYIRHHHERFAGDGYPCGLVGESIPLGGRIIAIADTYDAITSARPYRAKTMTHAEAKQELIRCSGSQFDPSLVNIFVKALGNNSQIHALA